MNDYKAIIEHIQKAYRILIYTHVGMDGDAVGSSLALCRTIRAMGKAAFIILEDDYPEYLEFLRDNMGGMPYFLPEAPYRADLAIAVDFSSTDRLESRKEAFFDSERQVCIDHHLGGCDFTDNAVVDPSASAAALLVLELFEQGGIAIDKKSAECIYVGILTDTGSFRYNSCDKRTLEAVARLYDYGISNAELCSAVYDNSPLPQLKLESLALERVNIFADGEACISWCTLKDLEDLGAKYEYADTCIDRIRTVKGVEMAAFVKEKTPGVFKVSLRSKSYGDVRTVAMFFGGGGHIMASGCTIEGTLDEAVSKMTEAMAAMLKIQHARHFDHQ
ncbi:MAG: bifunctional oligoribonuclease/PAP phosphatase NrnA [Firmicutes bacterium]|nr:bifunctional oligoribonuclease/PAP phosphatase NrnA [Bacillota bacterium]